MRRPGTAKSYTGAAFRGAGDVLPKKMVEGRKKMRRQNEVFTMAMAAPAAIPGRGRHRPVDKRKEAIFFRYAKTMFKTMQAATIIIASVSGRLCQASACEEGILVRL